MAWHKELAHPQSITPGVTAGTSRTQPVPRRGCQPGLVPALAAAQV